MRSDRVTRQKSWLFVAAFVLAVAASLFVNYLHKPEGSRIKLLEKRAEEERRSSDEAVAAYVPNVSGRLDDLTVVAIAVLKQLPGVASVEVLVAPAKPKHRIVHVRDWHFVPKELLAVDVRHAADRDLSNAEVEILVQEQLLEVELVQIEQEALLRCLVKHHGLTRVLAEGLTPSGTDAYRRLIESLRETDQQLADLAKNHQSVKGDNPAIDREIAQLVRGHQRRLLEYGSSGRLAIAGLLEVLPLDDAEALANAKPVRLDGTLRADPNKLEARHDAQVKAALDSGPCSVLILGGSHDLSASVRRLAANTEYIRVTTRRYQEIAE
jgi:hypothetical protein